MRRPRIAPVAGRACTASSPRYPGIAAGLVAVLLALPAPARAEDPPSLPPPADGGVDFAGDVLPILEERCHRCHGPRRQKSGLRLDSRQRALQGGDSGPALVPGASAESRLVRLVAGLDPEREMPPSGEPLSDREIGVLRAWIDDGAPWSDEAAPEGGEEEPLHWVYRPLERPDPPAVEDPSWCRTPIDRFILARLEAEGVEPSPAAGRATLARRAWLDLLGLPPPPGAVERFVADRHPGAWERLVDRLLASPHYGERQARLWLDLARYADSDGYEKDRPRPWAWRWREWVIDAYNRDLPYDRFTVEQLAGDLLPEPTTGQLVATGFHRNTLHNAEGGVDREEDRVKKTVDRTNTTGAVWLGLTVGCAQCHSHKYDRLTQREYYRFYAFFNQLEEVDIPAPRPGELAELRRSKARWRAERERLAERLAARRRTLDARLESELAGTAAAEPEWRILRPEAARSREGAPLRALDDGSVRAGGEPAARDAYVLEMPPLDAPARGIRLEALTADGLPGRGPGRAGNGNFVLSELRVEVLGPADGESRTVGIARASADHAQDGYPAAAAGDEDPGTGWAIAVGDGSLHVDRTAVFELDETLPAGARLRLTLRQEHGRRHLIGRWRLAATGEGGLALHAASAPPGLLAGAGETRSEDALERLRAWRRSLDPAHVRLERRLAALETEGPPEASVRAQALRERDDRRVTRIHRRGNFLDKGDRVEAGVPAVLPPLEPRGETPDRLDLARWLVDPRNPLPARVAANRLWRLLFGRGIVETVDDFGVRGEEPSHPELLDWLAVTFVETDGWSRKAFLRRILLSSAYRQSSAWRPELAQRDPANRLVARQGRFRLEAEVVRDIQLAASGLLVREIGGPSVRPPLPEGIADLGYANSVSWKESEGAGRYRRGLYTFRQRTVPYPMLATFDAPDFTVTCTRRERSNTPLQALTLLNDPVFVECARAFGRRALELDVPEGTAGDRRRVEYVVRHTLGRSPDAVETQRLLDALADFRAATREDPEAARRLAQGTGDGVTARVPGVPPEESAAWTALARVVLNLDETITRE